MGKESNDLKQAVLSAVGSLEKGARHWMSSVASKAARYQSSVNDKSWSDEEQEVLQGCSEKCDEIQTLSLESAQKLKCFSQQVLTTGADVVALSENNKKIIDEIKRVENLTEQLREKMESLDPVDELDDEQLKWLADAKINLADLEDIQTELEGSLRQAEELNCSLADKSQEISEKFTLITEKESNIFSDSAEVLKSNIESLYIKATERRDVQNSFLEGASAFFSEIKDKCIELGSRIKNAFSRSKEACEEAEQLLESCPSNRAGMHM